MDSSSLLPVSYFMEGRDPTQLVYRWNQVLDPSLKRGSWTEQEDRVRLPPRWTHPGPGALGPVSD